MATTSHKGYADSSYCIVSAVKQLADFAMHRTYLKGGNKEFLARKASISYYRVDYLRWYHAGEAPPDKSKGKKAASFTKDDLLLLMEHFYTTATTPQNAALVRLVWYVFGRTSVLSLLPK